MRVLTALLLTFLASVAFGGTDVPLTIPATCCVTGGSMAHVALSGTGAAFVWSLDGLRAAVVEGLPPIPSDEQTFLSSGNYRDPALASDGKNALVVWIENEMLFAQRIGPDVAETERQIIADNVGVAAPAVAWNGWNYVIAWSHASNALLTTTIDDSGRPSGMINIIQQNAGEVPETIAIASSGDDSFVVWQRDRFDLNCPTGCQGLPILTSQVDAAVVDRGGRARNPFSIITDAGLDPRVAWNGVEYFVIWSGLRRGIVGRRFYSSGVAIDPAPLTIAEAPDYQGRIAWNGTSYFVVWLHQVFAEYQVFYAPVDETGRRGTLVAFAGRLTFGFDIAGRPNGSIVLVHDSGGLFASPPTVRFVDPRRRAIAR